MGVGLIFFRYYFYFSIFIFLFKKEEERHSSDTKEEGDNLKNGFEGGVLFVKFGDEVGEGNVDKSTGSQRKNKRKHIFNSRKNEDNKKSKKSKKST